MNRYNANVRIGNWFDEIMLQDEKTKQYVRKNKNGELKVQRARQIFLNLLEEVPLTFPVVGLSYGAVIAIVSPGNPPATKFQVKAGQGIALAANIDLENIDKRCNFDKGDQVIGSGLLTPCARSVWTIVPDDKSKDGKELRFGDAFHIQLTKSNPPLYMYAPLNSPLESKGECKRIVPKLQNRTSNLSRFRVVHHNPRLRYDSEGSVVPPFEKIAIIQAASTEALAVEPETWFPTYFGMECEVSLHTYREAKDPKKPDPRNFCIYKEQEKRDKCRDLLIDWGQQYPKHRIHMVVLIIGCMGGMKGNFILELEIIPACRHNSKHLTGCRKQSSSGVCVHMSYDSSSRPLTIPWEGVVER